MVWESNNHDLDSDLVKRLRFGFTKEADKQECCWQRTHNPEYISEAGEPRAVHYDIKTGSLCLACGPGIVIFPGYRELIKRGSKVSINRAPYSLLRPLSSQNLENPKSMSALWPWQTVLLALTWTEQSFWSTSKQFSVAAGANLFCG